MNSKPGEWPVIVDGMVIPSDPPRYTEEQVAAGWARVLAALPAKAKLVPMPVEALYPEIPLVPREWAVEIGTENGVPYLGMVDNWGNEARAWLDASRAVDGPLAVLIAAYLETHGEDVPA